MAIRDKLTTKGGNRAYRMVRSKISKDENGYGKVVSVARERMMQKLGKDPGYNIVAAHDHSGSHFEKDGGEADPATRAENTSDSNRLRKLKKKLKEAK